MPSQAELDKCYIECAYQHAKLSKATRKKVGACLVTPAGVIIPGYNGTPSGTDNACEFFTTQYEYTGSGTMKPFREVLTATTKPEVIHAELNCILKAAQSGISIAGSTLYCTLQPCVPCAAFLVQCKIKEVVYHEDYRIDSGKLYLINNGVVLRQYKGDIHAS